MGPFKIPIADDDPPPSALVAMLNAADADWKRVRSDPPLLPELCSTFPPNVASETKRDEDRKKAQARKQPPPKQKHPLNGDLWFPRDYRNTVFVLAQRLHLLSDEKAIPPILKGLRATLPTATVKDVVPTLLLNPPGAPGKPATQMKRKLERTERCPFITAYLQPLLTERDYGSWLVELAASQFSWKGGSPASPRVPLSVQHAERAHEGMLITTWMSRSASGTAAGPASGLVSSEMQRFLASEPAALGESEVSLVEKQPAIIIGGKPLPANLFISEAAAAIEAYLKALDPVLQHASAVPELRASLRAVAYGVVALGLVPIACIYDGFHGTCAIETLLPKLEGCRLTLVDYGRGRLQSVLAPLRSKVSAAIDDPVSAQAAMIQFDNIAKAFGQWIGDIAELIATHYKYLLWVVANQCGGRVRTPVRLTPEEEWRLPVVEKKPNGSSNIIELRAQELIGYLIEGGKSQRDTQSEVFWMLPSTWSRLGTAIALVNQAGMRCWFNAANNRWGGYHPPHIVHRQGYSFDIDVGFGWKAGHKVPNVRKRGTHGVFLDDYYANNHDLPICLHGMNRVAGWILVQAFVLVGIDQYLYGDAALVGEASRHLATHFNLPKAAHMDGTVDAEGHSDHWHFELLVGKPANGAEPFVWEANTADLFSALHKIAKLRDADDKFWERMAGLTKAPTQEGSFDSPPDFWDSQQGEVEKWEIEKENWKKWWRRRSEPCGIPLLPVWVDKSTDPTVGEKTLPFLTCWEKGGGFPEVFDTGGLAG